MELNLISQCSFVFYVSNKTQLKTLLEIKFFTKFSRSDLGVNFNYLEIHDTYFIYFIVAQTGLDGVVQLSAFTRAQMSYK